MSRTLSHCLVHTVFSEISAQYSSGAVNDLCRSLLYFSLWYELELDFLTEIAAVVKHFLDLTIWLRICLAEIGMLSLS